MIVLVTTPGHGRTWRSLLQGRFGCPTPKVGISDYGKFFMDGKLEIPVATYLFADLDRLAPWELRHAAELYRTLTGKGLRCLNDPAVAMARVELLTTLHRQEGNPIAVLRADTDPRPTRFPVFLRYEDDHHRSSIKPYQDQTELDEALLRVRGRGIPLRGLLVIEYVAEKYNDKFWGKWGTWRIGDRMVVEHLLLEDKWQVKQGHYANLDDAAIADEHDAVKSNRFADELRPVFDTAAIEFGRADHAFVDGRNVVYEINTNPHLAPYEADPRPLREQTILLSRTRLAEALTAIDTAKTGAIGLTGMNVEKRP